MTNSERRLQLFKTYSTNWKLVRPSYPWTENLSDEFEEAVICPLCLALLPKENLNQNVGIPLTLEHIPPSDLGGKPKILTCKKCNNDSGRRLDHTISDYLKTRPFFSLQDGAKIDIRKTSVQSDVGTLTSSATLTYLKDNTLHFHLNINKSESTRNDLFKKLATATKWQGEFSFNAPSLKYVHIALLRIGYLSLFCRFGNAFILNENYNYIRRQILNPELEILPSTAVLETKNQLPAGIYLLRKPKEIAGFYVSYSVRYKGIDHSYGVFIPSPFANAPEYYTVLKEYQGKKITINYDEFRDLDYLTNQQYVFSCLRVFQFLR